jgi:truncated hemoglobin YjbI
MRKIALQMYVTLDGVMEAPQNWSFDFWGDAPHTPSDSPAPAGSSVPAPVRREPSDERSTRGRVRSSWRTGRCPATGKVAGQARERVASRHRLIPRRTKRSRPTGLVPALNRAVRTAVVGPGRIGDNAAGLWSRCRDEVQIAFSRHPERLVALAAELGDHVGAAPRRRSPREPEWRAVSNCATVRPGACLGRGLNPLPEDSRLAPLFATMAPDHPGRAAWLEETFDGPKPHAENDGGYDRFVSRHLAKAWREKSGETWARLITQSADEARLPIGPESPTAFVSYIEWGTRRVVRVVSPQFRSNPRN